MLHDMLHAAGSVRVPAGGGGPPRGPRTSRLRQGALPDDPGSLVTRDSMIRDRVTAGRVPGHGLPPGARGARGAGRARGVAQPRVARPRVPALLQHRPQAEPEAVGQPRHRVAAAVQQQPGVTTTNNHRAHVQDGGAVRAGGRGAVQAGALRGPGHGHPRHAGRAAGLARPGAGGGHAAPPRADGRVISEGNDR